MEEKGRAQEALRNWPGRDRFIACSVGTKIDIKNWGEKNWIELFRIFCLKHKNYGLLLIGAADEFALSERLNRVWVGPKLNLCGRLSPRECAWALRQAVLFVGHDSGPLHLAACAGVRCVGIFSARNKPGVWFPYGKKHRVIYHMTECYGCELEVCGKFQKKCIATITVNEVMDSMEQIIYE
jgi:heptosyltransferase-3